MSANLFKEKRTKEPELREVCADCGNIKCELSRPDDKSLTSKRCECSEDLPKLSEEETATDANNLITEPREHLILNDRYEIIEVIGEGGMGTVYRARDRALGKDFAVKVLRKNLVSDEAAIRRFEQEADIACGFTHVNLLSVYGNGRTVDGAPYIVMDLLEGKSLGQVLSQEGKLDSFRAINLSIQICEALAHAHMKGLIHRDLKPSNIMLINNAQSTDIVKVLDFGIAKVLRSANRETQNLTQTGEVFGSPSYMSPEQCLSFSMDGRSDIYSLGCLMFEMLTGKPPFIGKNPIQTVVKHLNEPAPSLETVIPKADIPAGLERIILRCLEKDAEFRYQSMDQLHFDLQLISTGQLPKEIRKKKQSKPISLILLLAIPSVVIVFAVISGLVLAVLSIIWSYNLPTSLLSNLALVSYILGISYLAMWITAVSQRLVALTTIKERIDKWQRFWRGSTLVPSFFGFLLSIGVLFLNYPGSGLNTPKLAVTLFIGALVLFSISLLAAMGRFINSVIQKKKLKPAVILGINFSCLIVIVALISAERRLLAPGSYLLSGYDMAIFLDHNFPEAYYQRGLDASGKEKSKAIRDFTKVLSLPAKPGLACKALLQRARLYYQLADYRKAIGDLSLVINQYDAASVFENHGYYLCYDLASIYIVRARCYQKTGQFENAINDYNEVVNLKGSPRSALNERGRYYEQMGNYKKALSDYSLSIKMYPEQLPAYLSRGLLYKKLKESDKAAEDFRAALDSVKGKMDPPDGGVACHALSTAARELVLLEESKKYQAAAAFYDSRNTLSKERLIDHLGSLEDHFPL